MNRYRYRVILALEDRNTTDLIGDAICRRLTIRFGGATRLQGEGYWAHDGNEFRGTYTGIMVEPCTVIEVCTVDRNRDLIQYVVKDVAQWAEEKMGIHMKEQWVHFEEEEVKVEHFQI